MFVVSVIIEDPEFTESIVNVTVPAGRSVKLGCSVRNLGSYKVWYYYFFPSEIEYVLNITIPTIYIFPPSYTETRIHYFDWTREKKIKHSSRTLSHYLDLANQPSTYVLFFGRKVIFQSNLPYTRREKKKYNNNIGTYYIINII